MDAAGEEDIGGGLPVRDLINRLCARHPRFGQMVYDTDAQTLTGSVAIFLNDRALELVDGLDSDLKDGDTLTIVSPIEGG
jgi:molybdopterin converting factor small subunit